MIPEKIGRYEIEKELGRGGMATVYQAHDPHFKREVAVKVLPGQLTHDPTFRARFAREAQTIAALEHPAIVPVYDYGEENEQPYLVMRLMSGGSLADQIKQGPLPMPEAAQIVNRLARALDYAHSQGVIHRDLKPGNILFDKQHNPYLADFGIAKLMEATTSFTGSAVVGTPAYMSPEQVKGGQKIDGRSDVYSLGIILYEMLTGRAPYQADTPIQVLMKHVLDPVPAIHDIKPDLPATVDSVVSRALAKDVTDRFSTAGELATAFSTTAGLNPPQIPVFPSQTKQQNQGKIPNWTWAIIGLAILLLLGWGGSSLIRNFSTPQTTVEVVVVTATNVSITSPFATNTPLSTHTPTDTATHTPIPPTPSRIPRSTSTMQPTKQVLLQFQVNANSYNLRSGPGTVYSIIGILKQGDVVTVLGQNANGSWYNIQLADETTGWVSSLAGELIGVETAVSIPTVLTIPPTPRGTSTATPTMSVPTTAVPPETEPNTPRPTSLSPTDEPTETPTSEPPYPGPTTPAYP